MAVSKRLRYEILRRDNHTCRYCGGSAPDVRLTSNLVGVTELVADTAAPHGLIFCGVCWGMLKERHEFAVAYLEEPADGA